MQNWISLSDNEKGVRSLNAIIETAALTKEMEFCLHGFVQEFYSVGCSDGCGDCRHCCEYDVYCDLVREHIREHTISKKYGLEFDQKQGKIINCSMEE